MYIEVTELKVNGSACMYFCDSKHQEIALACFLVILERRHRVTVTGELTAKRLFW